jgi:hypothetical protein
MSGGTPARAHSFSSYSPRWIPNSIVRLASDGSVLFSPVMRKTRYSAMPSQASAFDQGSGVFSLCHSSLQAVHRGAR